MTTNIAEVLKLSASRSSTTKQNQRSVRGESEQSHELKESDNSARASIPEAAGPPEPSIPESRQKVESGKHNVFTHFTKDRNCEVCRRTKIIRALCKNRTCDPVPRAEGWFDSSRSQSFQRTVWVAQRSQVRCDRAIQSVQKPTILRERTSVFKSFSRRRSQSKSDTQIINWNLAKLVNKYYGITVLRRLIVLRQMVLQSGQHAGWQRVHPRYFCNPVWMENGGLIP